MGHDPAIFISVFLVSIIMSHKEKVLNVCSPKLKEFYLGLMCSWVPKEVELLKYVNSPSLKEK